MPVFLGDERRDGEVQLSLTAEVVTDGRLVGSRSPGDVTGRNGVETTGGKFCAWPR